MNFSSASEAGMSCSLVSSRLVCASVAMSDPAEYPPIEPTTFDLIIVGTGLPESIISAASSVTGKSVLLVDPNPFYGSHYSSLSLPQLCSFLISNPTSSDPPPSLAHSDDDTSIVSLITRPSYTDVEVSSFWPKLLDDDYSRKFNVDVAGPRVFFCVDKSIQLMLQSGIGQYLEFKSIDGCFMGTGDDGNLWSVPDSRAAIIKYKNLKLNEKKQLTKFFKLVQNHLAYNVEEEEEEEEGTAARISEEDLERPFVEFLAKMGLPQKIKSYSPLPPFSNYSVCYSHD